MGAGNSNKSLWENGGFYIVKKILYLSCLLLSMYIPGVLRLAQPLFSGDSLSPYVLFFTIFGCLHTNDNYWQTGN